MSSVSPLGRLTIGVAALALAVAATAGLTAQAQATSDHRTATGVTGAGQARRDAGHGALADRHLKALAPAAPAAHGGGAPAGSGPRISSVVPAEGAPGWPVTLSGARFTGITAVRIGGVSAAYTVSGPTLIAAIVPAGAASGQITVTGRDGTVSHTFTVTPAQTLEPGETLPSGDALHAKDGQYTLTMQSDGDLVYSVAGSGRALWSSGTAAHPGAYLSLLGNGNLVLYSATGGTRIWSTRTAGHGPARLVAQTNGNITLYDGGTRTWTAGTLDNQLDPGESLRPGWFLSNRRGDKLVMRRTGNATLTTAAGQVWASGTAGHPGAALTMRRTGDLVLAAPGARVPLWTSATSGHPGARLIDQRSGVLAVRGQGHVLWTSRRAPVATLTLGQWPGRAGPRAAARYYGYPYSDPPACTDGGACHADQWAFYQGQCTSWVAYQLNQKDGLAFTNSFGGQGRWGNAVNWAARARKLGVTVNDTPTAGSVAWYAATKAAPDGHVAFVERVTSGSAIVISEMNYDGDNGFWVHALTKTTGDWPTAFIHLARA